MLPIGELALYFALAVAIILTYLPLVGVYTRNTQLMRTAKPLTLWLFSLVLIAFICLGMAFWYNDFSYQYVYQHSNTQLPTIFKLTAIWGGHEGSMLLWVLTLALWMLGVALFTRKIPIELSATTLAILGAVSAGFIAFVLFTSNPFDRLPTAIFFDGRDLNPLLQDIGLVIHPPLLYMGYVGFAVPYAFVCALLITGHIDRNSIRWLRPWALGAWLFLTLGITVGSWWAYYELGWGGWWFWDPVENASLIPWILGTALIHSLAATEKRQVFSVWSVLLAILCFALSVLGTFLVRSGILTSVHSFAADPSRGMIILILLGLITGFGIVLLLIRAGRIRQEVDVHFVSREMGILLNNILLSIACFVVILGTLYPLIVDILKIGKISVGAGYFNRYVNPIALLLLILLGVTPLLRFKNDQFLRIKTPLIIMAIMALVLGIASNYLYANTLDFWVVITLVLSYWIVLGVIFELHLHKPKKASFLKGLISQSPARLGMNLGHLGVVVVVVGIALTSHYSTEQDRLVKTGQTVIIKEYGFTLNKLERVKGPNYIGTKATIEVTKNNQLLRMMYPEKRIYSASGMPISEIALRASLVDDLYVALAEERAEDAWAMRIYVKPFVRWIWMGGIIIALAALVSMCDRRYRSLKSSY